MKINAVIISVNYSDFLRFTLPSVKHQFDKTIVVTTMTDLETPKICEFHNVECIRTNAMDKPNSKSINKAAGINQGIKYCDKDAWILQLDADIWLPSLTRHILERCSLDETKLYGIDRLMCNSFKDWVNFYFFKSRSLHEGWIFLHLNDFHVGERIVRYMDGQYYPIGFFQLWKPDKSGVYIYPQKIDGNMDNDDLLHVKQFLPDKRGFIPELISVHLASRKHEMGQNWKGRATKNFIPTLWSFELVEKIAKIIWWFDRFKYKKKDKTY